MYKNQHILVYVCMYTPVILEPRKIKIKAFYRNWSVTNIVPELKLALLP